MPSVFKDYTTEKKRGKIQERRRMKEIQVYKLEQDGKKSKTNVKERYGEVS